MRKILSLLVVALFISTSVWAKPDWAAKKAPKKVSESTAVERVGDEIADSVADILTGGDTKKPSNGNLPPGLAKKDKVPPGWAQGKKTGWGEKEDSDSPIKQFFKKLFSKQS